MVPEAPEEVKYHYRVRMVVKNPPHHPLEFHSHDLQELTDEEIWPTAGDLTGLLVGVDTIRMQTHPLGAVAVPRENVLYLQLVRVPSPEADPLDDSGRPEH